jgi:7-cyano-7-deazaguanine synthase
VKSAIILLSGGLDSATAAAMARADGFDLVALSFDYGQRHRGELESARALATHLGVARHLVQQIDLRCFGGSALTDDISVPKDRPEVDIESGETIPVTYVPARNTVFLAMGLACAESLNIANIFIGVNALDYSGYPDCRPEFIAKFQELAMLATRAGIEGREIQIHTPLMKMTKAEIIVTGHRLGLDYALTTSCYDPNEDGRKACGRCDSCQLRRRGFETAGIPDPTPYSTSDISD